MLALCSLQDGPLTGLHRDVEIRFLRQWRHSVNGCIKAQPVNLFRRQA